MSLRSQTLSILSGKFGNCSFTLLPRVTEQNYKSDSSTLPRNDRSDCWMALLVSRFFSLIHRPWQSINLKFSGYVTDAVNISATLAVRFALDFERRGLNGEKCGSVSFKQIKRKISLLSWCWMTETKDFCLRHSVRILNRIKSVCRQIVSLSWWRCHYVVALDDERLLSVSLLLMSSSVRKNMKVFVHVDRQNKFIFHALRNRVGSIRAFQWNSISKHFSCSICIVKVQSHQIIDLDLF